MLSYRIEGKQRRITLKAQGLKEAREERDDYRKLIKQGKDPHIGKHQYTAKFHQVLFLPT